MSKLTYPQKPIIVVVGPTASGKSDLAVFLAKKFNGEVISADSRQVYKGMDIGTGKVPLSNAPLTQRGAGGVKPAGYYGDIAHYLINVASPGRRFTAGQYKKLGQAAIKNIQNKNKIPIICGGTGFYIRMLVDDLQVPAVKPDLKLRAKLEKKTTEELFAELKKLDPRRAAAIDRHNPRRLVRALEIIMTTGRPVPPLPSVIPGLTRNPDPGSRIPPSLKATDGQSKYGMTNNNVLFLGVQIPRPKLAQRIKARLEKRLRQGMLSEVKKLRKQGVSWKRLDSFGLEYRWLARFLQNKISYEEMTERLQKDIEHYAKRQMTWFGKDKRIRWITSERQAANTTKRFLQ